jgi:hypothetical protein
MFLILKFIVDYVARTKSKKVISTEPRVLYRKRPEIVSLFSKISIHSIPQEIIHKTSFDLQDKHIQAMISQFLVKCT